MTSMRQQALRLYAQCLRSARKCPEWKQRETMKAYVRMKFRAEVGARDTDHIRRLLADGREELDRMEYYHSVYAEKQRQKATTEQSVERATEASLSASTATEARPDACPSCGVDYQPPQAKFCSNCGEKRK